MDNNSADDDQAQLRRFGAELRKFRTDDSPEAILARTRLDRWEPPRLTGSTTEIEEYVDPATGGRLRAWTFQGAPLPPAEWPEGWPFIAGIEAQYGRVERGSEVVQSLVWAEPDNAHALAEIVRAAMPAFGWHEHAIEDASKDPRQAGVVWFHDLTAPSGHQWRLLSIFDDGTTRAVVLAEVRPEVMAYGPAGLQP